MNKPMDKPMDIETLIARLNQIKKDLGNIDVFVEGAAYIMNQEMDTDIRPPFNTQDFEKQGNHIEPSDNNRSDDPKECGAYVII